jgi:hypothetical protein
MRRRILAFRARIAWEDALRVKKVLLPLLFCHPDQDTSAYTCVPPVFMATSEIAFQRAATSKILINFLRRWRTAKKCILPPIIAGANMSFATRRMKKRSCHN